MPSPTTIVDGASTTAAGQRLVGGTSLTVVDGSRFGTPTPSNPMRVQIGRSGQILTILKATGRPSANVLTIDGTFDGYEDAAVQVGDVVVCGWSKGDVDDLWGDLAGKLSSAAGSVGTANLADDAVTFAKFQNSTGTRLIGAVEAGNFGEISVGSNLSLTDNTLSVSGGAYLLNPLTTKGDLILGAAVQTIDAARTGTASVVGSTGSTTPFNGSVGNIIDGNDGSSCISSDTGVAGTRYIVDLGSAKPILAFRLLQQAAGNNVATAAVVESSDDNATWTVRWTSSTTLAGNTGTVALATTTTARYWRIRATAGGTGGWVVWTLSFFQGLLAGEPIRFPVGLNGQALVADSAQTDGLKYGMPYGVTTPANATTITLDLNAGGLHAPAALTANRTLAVSNAARGRVFYVLITQDATGSRTVTWWSGIIWAEGSAPTLTTTAAKRDLFRFVQVGASEYLGSVVAQNF